MKGKSHKRTAEKETSTKERIAEINDALKRRDEGDIAGALKILKNVIREYPKNPGSYGLAAGILSGQRKYKEAAYYARKAVAFSPSSALASILLFISLDEIGDPEGAIAEFRRFRSRYKSDYYASFLEDLMEQEPDAEKRRFLKRMADSIRVTKKD